MRDGDCSATAIGDAMGRNQRGRDSSNGPFRYRRRGLPHCATRVPTLQESGAEIYPPTFPGLEGRHGAHVTGLGTLAIVLLQLAPVQPCNDLVGRIFYIAVSFYTQGGLASCVRHQVSSSTCGLQWSRLSHHGHRLLGAGLAKDSCIFWKLLRGPWGEQRDR